MKPNQRGVAIAASALAVAGGGAWLSVVGQTANAAATQPRHATHTEKFKSRTVKNISLDKTGDYVELATDTKHGKQIGGDSSSGRYHAATGKVTGRVSFQRKQGVIYATFSLNTQTAKLTGKVVGGAGIYKGVTGTLSGRAVNRKLTSITMTY